MQQHTRTAIMAAKQVHITKSKYRVLVLENLSITLSALTGISRCIFRRLGRAWPVSNFSPIRHLSQVFTLLRVEKLRSTPAVLTGKVRRIVRNEIMNGNVWRSHATNPSSGVPGTASSGFMACVRTHFCRHKSTSPRSMNSSTGAGRQGLYVFTIFHFIHFHLFCKKQLTECNCTIKLENWLKKLQQFKHTITDKITSAKD